MHQLRKATEVYAVLDLVQDYEESDTLLGVYGSLQAAKYALRYHRRYTYYALGLRTLDGANYGAAERETVIQRWRGHQVVEQWTFSRHPSTGAGEWEYKNLRKVKEKKS